MKKDKTFAEVAKMLSGIVPGRGCYVSTVTSDTQLGERLECQTWTELTLGVLLTKAIDGGTAYVLLYQQEHAGHNQSINVSQRGMTGFVIGKSFYSFDRHGFDDSWYPYDSFKGKHMPEGELVDEMFKQLEYAEKRLVGQLNLQRTGCAGQVRPDQQAAQ